MLPAGHHAVAFLDLIGNLPAQSPSFLSLSRPSVFCAVVVHQTSLINTTRGLALLAAAAERRQQHAFRILLGIGNRCDT